MSFFAKDSHLMKNRRHGTGTWNHGAHTWQGYHGYFRKPHWFSMGLPAISMVTWQVWTWARLSHTINNITVDDLKSQEDTASQAMVLTCFFSWIFRVNNVANDSHASQSFLGQCLTPSHYFIYLIQTSLNKTKIESQFRNFAELRCHISVAVGVPTLF